MKDCHYHKMPITYFCTHIKCTLPLCDECVSVHSKEMLCQNSHNQAEYIQSYEAAKQKAYSWLNDEKRSIQEVENCLDLKLEKAKQELAKEINIEFGLVRQQIIKRLKLKDKYLKVKQRKCLIENGSLKQLILAFQDLNDHQNQQLYERQKLKCQIGKINHKVHLKFVKELIENSLLIPPSLAEERQTTYKLKKGLALTKTLEISDVKTYRDFRKVINTKDIYMSSPQSTSFLLNTFKQQG